jgi:outer membrane protein OmpA-like peptidoglycan-associated protein
VLFEQRKRDIAMKASTTICTAAAWLICGTLACASDKQPANSPSAELTPASGQLARNDRETTVRLSEEIMTECRFPASPSDLPRFELDKSTLRGPDKNTLDDVANCLKDGPLQNRTITIIGRTDPRGSDQHNHELGANRAEAARNYLLQRGVSEQKVLVISRGEEGAAGSTEDSWALDRRVDLVLGDRTERSGINQNPAANSKANATTGGNGSPYADQSEGSPASGKVTGSSGPGTDSVPGK